MEETLRPLAREAVVLPAIVYAELVVGVERADTPLGASARKAKITALFDRVPLIDFGVPSPSAGPSSARR